ncbi:hypothetical protein GPECTOR_82g235 [Gonium pectorale]|uniref:Uncharacterized protein n=1 Tax=Gonium pectorale TaxID=33097 RepID=A0A150G1L5_GONPE|nr:hypothetical protein GPECTOR_82g235 [Gonium pectorale]|eukprot:KXZ43701.1 hypothetical protein GPECTOR_82g235 [Gonium pectorale]
MAYLELLRSAPKRTLSDLLRKLPQHGVGALVTRDTWHPEGNKYWEVVEVVPQLDDPSRLGVWGYQYYKGERVNENPKRIASVWKYGWVLKPSPQEAGGLQELAARRAAACSLPLVAAPSQAAQASQPP